MQAYTHPQKSDKDNASVSGVPTSELDRINDLLTIACDTYQVQRTRRAYSDGVDGAMIVITVATFVCAILKTNPQDVVLWAYVSLGVFMVLSFVRYIRAQRVADAARKRLIDAYAEARRLYGIETH